MGAKEAKKNKDDTPTDMINTGSCPLSVLIILGEMDRRTYQTADNPKNNVPPCRLLA